MAGELDPESMLNRIDELEKAFREKAEEVEREEEDLAQKENKTEQAERSEDEELTEGEQGNPAEIEDAEKKMERILKFLGQEEREADDIESKIKDELEIALDEANVIVEMESGLDEHFRECVAGLEQELNTFKSFQSRGQIRQRHYSGVEEVLQDIRFSSEIFRRALEKEEELFEQLQELEDEENRFEHLAGRIKKELDVDRDELRRIVRDTEKIGTPEDVEHAREEGQELQQLFNHFQDEESGVRRIDQEIEAEIEELGKIIGEDEQILEEMERCRELLEELERIVRWEAEKGILGIGGDPRAEELLEDIDKTDKQLKKMLSEDREFVESLEEGFSTLRANSPVSARETGKTALKAFGLLAVALIVLVLIDGQGPIFTGLQ